MLQADGLLGIHLSTPYAFPDPIPGTLTAEERRAVDGLAFYGGPLGGSNHVQGTKPETIGFALADSPAGQAAWIYEKFQSKTDNRTATMAGPTLTLPVAVTVFPRDIPLLPRTWIEEKYSNLVHFGEADRGGHFAALEQPGILVDELRTGLRSLRA